MRTSEGNSFYLTPYLNYLGTPLQVLLFSAYGNVTSIRLGLHGLVIKI